MAHQVGIGKGAVARIRADHSLNPWRVDTLKVGIDPHFESCGPTQRRLPEASPRSPGSSSVATTR